MMNVLHKNLSLSQLFDEGEKDPCGDWMVDLFDNFGIKGEIQCSLPQDHEDKYGISHTSKQHLIVWGDGQVSQLWFEER